MMVGQFFVFLVLTGACQFGHGVGGFTTKFIHLPAHAVSVASAPSTARYLDGRCEFSGEESQRGMGAGQNWWVSGTPPAGSARKLRAADRLSYFMIVLRAKRHTPATRSRVVIGRSCVVIGNRHREQGKHRERQYNSQATALHSSSLWRSHTSRSRRGNAVASWCVELHVSTSRTPPHCEGHPPSQWTSQRWGWAIPMSPLPQGGIRVAMAPPRDATSLPRDGYCLLFLTPPRARIRGSAAAWRNGTARRHTLKMRVECSKNT